MEDSKTINQEQHKKDVAIIWARVSQESQDSALEFQVKACNDYADKHGIEIARIFKVASSGFGDTLNEEMLPYVAQHPEVNTILVFSFDKLSRREDAFIIYKAFLKTKGINVVSVTQPLESETVVGSLIDNVLFLYTHFENNFCRACKHRPSRTQYEKE